MVRKRQAREPLFYIQQPKISKPVAPMQDHYSTPRKTQKDTANDSGGSSSFNMPTRGNNFHQFQSPQPSAMNELAKENESEQSPDDQTESAENDKDDANQEKSRSKFKDMTISEKIDYFVHMPTHIPKLKCEVTTGDRTYRGIIIDREEQEEGEAIVMRTGRRTTTVRTESITAIRLLGL